MGSDPLEAGRFHEDMPALPRPPDPDDWRDRVDIIRDSVVSMFDHDRRWRIVAGIGAVGLALIALWWFARPSSGAPPIEDALPTLAPAAVVPVAEAGATQRAVVHVAGAVLRPGVVDVEPDARVEVAVAAAGGALADADIDRINLARPVQDGERIYVPLVGEAVVAELGPDLGTDATAPIDINRATTDQLDALPGVGPTTAANIVAHREANGPFTSVSDLESVPGIGPAKLEQLRELAVAG
jgi:competence protein ComEA